mgnify:CR=1 FL=1
MNVCGVLGCEREVMGTITVAWEDDMGTPHEQDIEVCGQHRIAVNLVSQPGAWAIQRAVEA